MTSSDKTIAYYTAAIERNPQDAEAYRGRGLLYYQKDDLPRAIADLSDAIRLRPDFTEAYVTRSLAYHKIQAFDEANRDLRAIESLQRDREGPASRSAPGVAAAPQVAGGQGRAGHSSPTQHAQSNRPASSPLSRTAFILTSTTYVWILLVSINNHLPEIVVILLFCPGVLLVFPGVPLSIVLATVGLVRSRTRFAWAALMASLSPPVLWFLLVYFHL